MRKVEERANRKSSFPQEEAKSGCCKSGQPRGFCREGMRAPETDRRRAYCTEDHPPLSHTLSLTHWVSFPPPSPSRSLSRTHTFSCCALTDGKTLPRRSKGWEECVSSPLLHSGVFSGVLLWAVNFSPTPEDEEDLFVRKTQQKKRKQEATGWPILRVAEDLFFLSPGSSKVCKESRKHQTLMAVISFSFFSYLCFWKTYLPSKLALFPPASTYSSSHSSFVNENMLLFVFVLFCFCAFWWYSSSFNVGCWSFPPGQHYCLFPKGEKTNFSGGVYPLERQQRLEARRGEDSSLSLLAHQLSLYTGGN